MSLPEAVRTGIDGAACFELLARLVREPSHPGVPRQEEGVVRLLAEYLGARGLETQVQEAAPGRPNLLCTLDSGAPGRHLALVAHTDTVPLNVSGPGVGFSAEVRDGRMLGRGTVDMKGALAAMAAALVALRQAGALAAGRLTLAAVVDEEMESLGAEDLVRRGFRADGAIVGEPTDNQVCVGHKGLEWLEVAFTGRAAHGGTPEAGVNAIVGAARFVRLLDEELAPRLRGRAHPILGAPTVGVGTIRGGDQPSTVAAACTLTLDRRSVPGEDYASIVAELRDLLAQVEAGLPGLTTRVGRMPGGMATLEHVGFATPPDHPLVRAVQAASGDARLRAFPAWTDGALLSAFAGVPCVVLGPGSLALAHTPDEWVALDEVQRAAEIYAATALAFCAGRP